MAMISVREAERLVLENVGRLPTERRKLKEIDTHVLRQAIVADRDGPPFDRATLDGVCLRFADWAAGRRVFHLAGAQAAGEEPVGAPPEGECLEIMTGAPVPAPCDSVLPVEDFIREGEEIRASADAKLEAGAGIHARGSDFAKDAVLVLPGCRMTGREIAVAATCGCDTLEVTVQPKIAILSTGDEIVDVEDVPKPHQIRRSNDLALRAPLLAAGYTNIEINHLPDEPHAISWNLERLLQQADVIVVTGGVSKGRFDFLPKTLEELAVKAHFHGVAQRPGRPMWFGTFDRPGDFLHPEDTRVVAVFALPGNPVSCFTCLHRYVLPALARMSGVDRPAPPESVVLGAEVRAHRELTLFMPVALETGADGHTLAQPRPFNTSGDLASVAATHGFVEVAPDGNGFSAGASTTLIRWS